MGKRSFGLVVGSAGAVVLALAAVPARDALAVDTEVTFDVTAGALTITAPATFDFGDVNPGQVVDEQLEDANAITVTDNRGTDADWVATVYGEDFTSGVNTIAIENLEYWSGPATASAGGGTFTPGQLTRDDRDPVGDGVANAITAFTHADGTAGSSATWEPGLVLNVPFNAVIADDYTATVTHSVA